MPRLQHLPVGHLRRARQFRIARSSRRRGDARCCHCSAAARETRSSTTGYPSGSCCYAANHVATTAQASGRGHAPPQPTDRMLGAIVPHGAQTWYFKMTGPMEAVASRGSGLSAADRVVRFESDQSPPQWTLPDSWKEAAGAGHASGDAVSGRGRPDVGGVGDAVGHFAVRQLVVGQRQSLAAADAVAADHGRPALATDHHARLGRGAGHAGESAGQFRERRHGQCAALGRGDAQPPGDTSGTSTVVDVSHISSMSIQLTASDGVGDGHEDQSGTASHSDPCRTTSPNPWTAARSFVRAVGCDRGRS